MTTTASVRSRAVFGAMALLASLLSANANAREPVVREVFRDGTVWHQAVCDHAVSTDYATCNAHVRTDAKGNILTFAAPAPKGGVQPDANPAKFKGYGPADLHSAYNIPDPMTGSRNTIVAIVDAYGYPKAEADLATYRSNFGLPACTSVNGCFAKVNERGGLALPAYNSGWAQETALDLDMVSAMCPNCKILLVEATSPSNNDLSTAVNTAVAMGARVVSNSYSGGESSGDSKFASAYTHPGVAITASAGDGGYGAQAPATVPGVIAVGGTALVKDGSARGWSETVWNTSSTEGTGSGCSTVFTKPGWQHDTGCSHRMESDISAVADPATGVAVYGPTGIGSASAWLVFGGTSVSAPLIGGLYGTLGGAANAARSSWLDAGAHTNDVTSGSNGSCSVAYFCTAGVGYDGPTGWGTPNGLSALSNLAP